MKPDNAATGTVSRASFPAESFKDLPHPQRRGEPVGMKRTSMQNVKIIIARAAALSLCLLSLISACVFASHAAISQSSSDVIIQFDGNYTEKYRYSIDVDYASMQFYFDVHSIDYDEETLETHVSIGDWINGYGVPTPTSAVTVRNSSDIPLAVDMHVDDSQFQNCGVSVSGCEDVKNVHLPACRTEGTDGEEEIYISSVSLSLELDNYPDVEKTGGQKSLFVVIEAVAVSGVTTNGKYFYSDFDR